MRKFRFWVPITGCMVVSALLLMAQANRKPGLYQVTSSMSWQQSPMPSGMQMPGSSPHSTQVCITQAMIDKYDGPPPQSRGDCQVKNMVKNTDGMTADYVCTGHMNGTGKLEAHWTETGESHSKVHFTGTMQMGPQGGKPVEWTMESTSVFKGADCGSVKPMPIPAD